VKIIVAGGGTAGHVNAGVAILDEFRKQDSSNELLFIGTKRGIEKDLIPRAGYKIKYINSRGLNRESIGVLIYSTLLIPISIIQSLFIVLKFKPDAVIGVGGFASGPVVLSSALVGKNIFLVEQNAVMGFTNRMLSKFAKLIFSAFPLSKKFEHKVFMCGNPVRDIIKPSNKIKTNSTFTIFVFGGSQGARAINYCVIDAIQRLNELGNIKIYHQTGKLDHQKVKDAYKSAKFEHKVFDYTIDINKIYEEADLVVSRAGASTIFELINSDVPSVLIPLPTSADNHQYFNAKFLCDAGGAVMLEQKDLSPQTLVEQIGKFKSTPRLLDEMRQKIQLMEVRGKLAQKAIVEKIRELV